MNDRPLMTKMYNAIRSNDLETLKRIGIKKGNKWSTLHCAVLAHKPDIIKYLLSGLPVDLVDDDGKTPLFWALHLTHGASMVRLLLDHGAVPYPSYFFQVPSPNMATLLVQFTPINRIPGECRNPTIVWLISALFLCHTLPTDLVRYLQRWM
jgi:ankyrin repeat protein